MLLVVGDRTVSQPPMPWPLGFADAWATPIVASGFGSALEGWLGSATWLRVPDVRVLVLAFGVGDESTSPHRFVAAVAACAYNARARWPDAVIVAATPTAPSNARQRRWARRVADVFRARMTVDGIPVVDLLDIAPSDWTSIAAAVSTRVGSLSR